MRTLVICLFFISACNRDTTQNQDPGPLQPSTNLTVPWGHYEQQATPQPPDMGVAMYADLGPEVENFDPSADLSVSADLSTADSPDLMIVLIPEGDLGNADSGTPTDLATVFQCPKETGHSYGEHCFLNPK